MFGVNTFMQRDFKPVVGWRMGVICFPDENVIIEDVAGFIISFDNEGLQDAVPTLWDQASRTLMEFEYSPRQTEVGPFGPRWTDEEIIKFTKSCYEEAKAKKS